ncbi:CAMK family protein kinase [Trichomonas vaginalis G3]|uniref:CAMK family protein kinase n=1 Tax=Trichomonas vaginalis (strain ATCC PRA-98 / G3) TaxID=412133 RepID=A2DHE8_TRIV3|nr:protein serine/threonine kinase protein [Trichomonas vaginalis G3]EAY20221.1 CAMK family protein kinase [Trichomonas vaginalis G3]KAI5507716.1 protein serine/threonine kinase protein [Trichomonas vaginalis G3]|eukprot:XP_001581207.1 CAMK family protein kinase [Trichomonas vaginalis G3]
MDTPHAPTEQKIGPYIVIRTLGEGITGKVKLAVNKETNENVAIKIIPKSSFEKRADLQEKVHRECALMRLTDHPNILKLLAYYESARHIYIVLEYAKQGELFDYLISRRVLPEDQALDFFRQIILAIEYLHSFGICHRDLKPENILLDEYTRVKIADFGFARWVRSNIAETSCGSPHYAAPEVINGHPYDGRKADIWSCGIILFALLAGYLPFDDPSIRTLLHKVKRGSFQMPRFRPEIQDLIQKILTVDPQNRITIPEIKQHPAFRLGLNESYIFPSPVQYSNLEPIDIKTIKPELLDNLRQIGFKDDELETQLSSTENTMAKVFLSMLQERFDPDSLPWNQLAVSEANELSQEPIMHASKVPKFNKNSTDAFQRHIVSPSESYSMGAMSIANQSEWTLVEDYDAIIEDVFDTYGASIWQVMYNIQTFLNTNGMQWFHPDPQSFIARNEETNFYIAIEATFRTTDDVTILVRLKRGDEAEFNSIFESLKSTLGIAA